MDDSNDIEQKLSLMIGSIEAVLAMQARILDLIKVQISAETREWYSTTELAAMVGREPFTVRQWLLKGRLQGRKRPIGRGGKYEWEIHRSEVDFYRNHGLRNP